MIDHALMLQTDTSDRSIGAVLSIIYNHSVSINNDALERMEICRGLDAVVV